MEQSPWKANTMSAAQDVPHLVWFTKSHHWSVPSPCLTFRNKLFLWWVLDHLFLAVRDCLFSIFSATPHIWRPSPPSATRGLAMPWKYQSFIISFVCYRDRRKWGVECPRIRGGFIRKFPDWVDNETYAYRWYSSLLSPWKGYGGKIHYTGSQNSYTTAPSGKDLCHLQFSLQAANSETFGYTFVVNLKRKGSYSCKVREPLWVKLLSFV
jgi:hypothetical protein